MEKSEAKVDIKLFLKTLSPSITTAIWSIIIGVIFCASIIVLTRYKVSSIHQGYVNYVSGHHLTLGFLNKSVFSTGILGNALIFAFWLVAGVLVYVIAVDIVKGLRSTVEVEEELKYVHLNKTAVLRYNAIRFLIRLVTLAVWAPYLYVFFHKLLPEAVYLAIAASGAIKLYLRPIDAILSITLVAVAIHINIILLRLLFLRPRVFNDQILS